MIEPEDGYPGGKITGFFLVNTVAELTLFEPSDRLPEGL